MVRETEVTRAVENARELLRGIVYDCRTTVNDFMLWFKADTPFDQGDEFNRVIRNELYVAHELVEIGKVKAMGLRLEKDVITKNMQKVDDAHIEATRIELELAMSLRNTQHINDRVGHIIMWIEDSSFSPENKRKYRALRDEIQRELAALR